MSSKKRVADFEARANSDPDAIRSVQGLGRLLLVNPTADDKETLTLLGIEASQCIKVDTYWQFEDDVWFVQIQSADYDPVRGPGIYGRLTDRGQVNIVVIVDGSTISSHIVDTTLKTILEKRITKRKLPQHLIAL